MSKPAARRLAIPSAATAVEREVRDSILNQPFGAGTVADLNLPADFVRRCADRVIIASFNERHRIVVGDAPPRQPPPPPPPITPQSASTVRLIDGETMRDRRWAPLPPQATDVLRGFKFPDDGTPVPLTPPGESASYELRRASALIARRLAKSGLAATALEAAAVLRPFIRASPEHTLESLLHQAGLPIDLLAMLELEGPEGFPRGGCVNWLSVRLIGASPLPTARLRTALAAARLDFRPTLDSFRATDDAGREPPLLVRLQLTRADDWLGVGDGGSLDIARQVAQLLPTVPIVLTARQDHAPLIARHAAAWSADRSRTAPITLITESVTVSEWAQDNARAGTVLRAGVRLPAAILPRYASRAEELAAFVPGDSALAASLRAAGIHVARSPLHMQGGNTIVVNDVSLGKRILLLGEAEVYRNVALGLTEPQAIDALRVELGADIAVVLPAASYHIDYEVFCVTSQTTGGITAFVGESAPAERAIVEAGILALTHAGKLDAAHQDRLLSAIKSDPPELAAVVGLLDTLGHDLLSRGGFPIELAQTMDGHTPGESAVGNFLVFLDALDSLAARAGLAEVDTLPGHLAAALIARKRAEADRIAIRHRLESLGWKVQPVPSYTSGPRGVCPLNAVNAGELAIIPTSGGFFSPIAEPAQSAISGSDRSIRLIQTAESQRRNGSLRCAMAVFC